LEQSRNMGEDIYYTFIHCRYWLNYLFLLFMSNYEILNKKVTKMGTIYLVLINGKTKWVHEKKIANLTTAWDNFLAN